MTFREVPGSGFEGRDADDRTWDEMGVGRELWNDDDDWTEDDGDDVDGADPEGADGVPIETIWTRAYRIEAQLRAMASGSFAPDARDPDGLRDELFLLKLEMQRRGFPPTDWSPAVGEPAIIPERDVEAMPIPRERLPVFDDVLAVSLTDQELVLWRWIIARRPQDEVAIDLGITQAAVSKRETKLRAKINALHVGFDGKPFPFVPVVSRRGGRPRRA